MFLKFFALFFAFLPILNINLLSETKIVVTDVRPPFFILRITSDYLLSEKDRFIYSEKGNRVAEYIIINTSEDEVLCKYLNDKGEVNDRCYAKLKMISGELSAPDNKKTLLKTYEKKKMVHGSIRVRGIMFIERDNGVYFTENPVPASMIPGISYDGINEFLKKIADKCDLHCTVKYLTKSEIKKYSLLGKNGMMLGFESGSYFLLYSSGSEFRENPVSEKILLLLKYRIFIPLKLMKSGKG